MLPMTRAQRRVIALAILLASWSCAWGGITDVSVEHVMKDVAHEKERGEDERRDHGSPVGGYPACADKGKADEQSRSV